MSDDINHSLTSKGEELSNKPTKRTTAQNNALHQYCKLLSEALNEAGISQRVFLQDLEVDNSPESVKAVFRSLGKAKYLKDSTAKLTTKECSDIYEEINRQSSKVGIHIPFPSEEAKYLNY